MPYIPRELNSDIPDVPDELTLVVIARLQKWYEAIDYADALPISLNKEDIVSKERVNNLINLIDGYFEYQLKGAPTYFGGKGKTLPPQFSRLKGKARLAFYQDMKKLLINLYGEDYMLTDI